jgi:hypothetical protein
MAKVVMAVGFLSARASFEALAVSLAACFGLLQLPKQSVLQIRIQPPFRLRLAAWGLGKVRSCCFPFFCGCLFARLLANQKRAGIQAADQISLAFWLRFLLQRSQDVPAL